MKEKEERRLFERFEVECVGVSEQTDEEAVLWITDMSGQGLGFQTKKRLKENDRLLILLKMKDMKKPVAVRGSVVWARRADKKSCKVGFKLDPTSWVKIDKILKKGA